MVSTLMSVIVALTIITNIVSHWYLSKGNNKIVYRCNIAIFFGYAIVEGWIGLRDPEQRAILLYQISNVWCLIMACKGYWKTR